MQSETTTQHPFIVCDNLVKIYRVGDHDVVALQGLDMVVQPGEIMGVVGVSGSGKSTLMNILGGLDRPSAGRVWVDGKDLLKLSNSALDYYRLSKVGFVWQQSARNLLPYLSALKNVEMPLIIAGELSRKKKQYAEKLLDIVGLAQRSKHRLSELSGGEQQRVALAVALSNQPTLLLADEPTGEVDEATAQSIYQTIRDLNVELGLTILIVSHDTALAHHVDRVISIRDGKITTETVAGIRPPVEENAENGEVPAEVEKTFMDLTVLDSAGRLQVPKEYLEQFKIKGRVHLEIQEDGILIRPVPEHDQDHSAEKMATSLEKSRIVGGLAGWLKRLVPGGEGRSHGE
jgi:putative ABC transport system ATP-binding protein